MSDQESQPAKVEVLRSFGDHDPLSIIGDALMNTGQISMVRNLLKQDKVSDAEQVVGLWTGLDATECRRIVGAISQLPDE